MPLTVRRSSWLILATPMLLGCPEPADDDDDTSGDDGDSAHQDDLQHVQHVVFTRYCASCHDGSHPSGLDLTDGNAILPQGKKQKVQTWIDDGANP